MITLYRPVGMKELELIASSGWKAFPPRLEWQPIFYPVLHENYAIQIARDWNTQDAFSGYCGVVTAFELPEAYLSKFDIQNVGGAGHDELWVPAEELAVFNLQIFGSIRVQKVFIGEGFTAPENGELKALFEKII